MRSDLNHDPLTERLVDTADSVPVPDVPITQDIARGRRRRHRRRLALGGTALATAAIVGAGAVYGLAPGGDDAPTAQESGFAGGDRTPSGPEVTPPVENGQSELPMVDTEPSADAPEGTEPSEVDRQLQLDNREAIASIVDPDGQHISRQEIRGTSQGTAATDTGGQILDEKLGWTNPDEDGLGLIQVSIGSSPGFDCGAHPAPGQEDSVDDCTAATLDGLEVTEVRTPGADGPTYLYERSDGVDVAVTTSRLWGQNSEKPVSEVGVSDAQLAELLQSTDLRLPEGVDPNAPAAIPGESLRDAARGAVTGVKLTQESWAGELGGYYNARVVADGKQIGDLIVTDGGGNLGIDDPCSSWYASRCVAGEQDGSKYRIDYRRNIQGGGFDVTFEGPNRTVWAHFGPEHTSKDGYPVDPKDLVALAGDPALQE